MAQQAKHLLATAVVLAMGCAVAATEARAASMMQQCGQEYQAAKAANTLGGQTWPQYRSACAARLKGAPATAAEPAAATTAANPLKPASAAPAAEPPAVAATPATTPASAPAAAPAAAATPGTKPMSSGRAAFVARERQCGTEWKSSKATLISQTPGLTWPKYLSQCNARLKAAGQ